MAVNYIITSHISTKDLTRIFSKIEVDPKTECWNWIAGDSFGYGVISLNGNRLYIHRLMYSWLISPITEEHRKHEVDHLCRNRRCCNPAHLDLTFGGENQRRGNSPIGQNSRKTHCKNGHQFEGENLIRQKDKSRRCRICRDARRHTPQFRAKIREWRNKNIEKRRAKDLEYYYRHRERRIIEMRERYHRNVEATNAKQREYYQQTCEHRKQYAREWRRKQKPDHSPNEES